MRVRIDLCLPASWVAHFASAGHEAIRWNETGRADDDDTYLLGFAQLSGHVLLTADSDFGQLLFLSGRDRPSVIVMPEAGCLPEEPYGGWALAVLTDLERSAGCHLVLLRKDGTYRKIPLPMTSR